MKYMNDMVKKRNFKIEKNDIAFAINKMIERHESGLMHDVN